MAELCFAEHEFWIPGTRLVYVVKSLTNTLGQEPAEIGHSQTWHEAWVHGEVCILLESTLKSCKHLHLSKVSAEEGMCVCDCSAVWFTVFSNYVHEELTVPRVEQTTAYYWIWALVLSGMNVDFMACQLLDLLRTSELWLKMINFMLIYAIYTIEYH